MWKTTESSVSQILAGCSALAQTKYLVRHYTAPKILHFELLVNQGSWSGSDCSTLVFTSNGKAPVWKRERNNPVWRCSVYGKHRNKSEQNRREDSRLEWKECYHYRNELAHCWKPHVKRFRECLEEWNTSVEQAIPVLRSGQARHHYGRTWRVF